MTEDSASGNSQDPSKEAFVFATSTSDANILYDCSENRLSFWNGPLVCRWCSNGATQVIHDGPCPHVKAIEYHPDGAVKRVEFKDEDDADPSGQLSSWEFLTCLG